MSPCPPPVKIDKSLLPSPFGGDVFYGRRPTKGVETVSSFIDTVRPLLLAKVGDRLPAADVVSKREKGAAGGSDRASVTKSTLRMSY